MTDWTKFFGPNTGLPSSSASLQILHSFGPSDSVLDGKGIQTEGEALRIDVPRRGLFKHLFRRFQSVRCFEMPNPVVDNSLLVFRATMKTEGSVQVAYLEMWCRLSGRDYFSKSIGFGSFAAGTTDWTIYETPFLLQKGQSPQLVRLNVAVSGKGTIYLKDVALLHAPLAEPKTDFPTTGEGSHSPPENPETFERGLQPD